LPKDLWGLQHWRLPLRFLGAGRFKYADIENAVRRIVLEPVPGVKTEFTDRDRALGQMAEWAEKSTRSPVNLQLWMPSAAGSRHA
jgi:hypothetical protein